MDVTVAVYTDRDKIAGNVSTDDACRVKFEIWGVSDDDAAYLVKAWKQRWPIHGSVAVVTADTTVDYTAHAEPHAR